MSDPALTRIAAVGAYVAVIPIGAALSRRFVPELGAAPLSEQAAGAIAFGAPAISVVFAISVFARNFSPVVLGALGWLATVFAVRQLARGGGSGGLRAVINVHGLAVSGIAIAGLATIAFLYLGFPKETLIGDRDEGIYTLAALALEHRGSLVPAMPHAIVDLAPNLFRPFVDIAVFFLPGIYATPGGLVVQFSPLFPAWIAQAHAALGDVALYRTSALIALGSVTIFYVVARRLLPPAIALVSTVVFALNAAQIWIARINLSESLAQLLVLCGLWAILPALRSESRSLAAVAGGMLGLAALAHLDAVVLAPLVVGAACLAKATRDPRAPGGRKVLATFAVAVVTAQVAGVMLVAFASPPYVATNFGVLELVSVACALGLVVLAILPSRVPLVATVPGLTRVLAWTCALALVVLFAYAAWWRPHVAPFATIARPGNVLNGQRDFRENSLVNLATYLGWPVLFLALGGAVGIAIRVFRSRERVQWLLVWTLAVPAAVAVLANPRVSPDHFWAIRRFLVIVIPGIALVAGYGLELLLDAWQQRWAKATGYALAIAASVSLLMTQRATLLVRENRGLTPQIATLAKATADAHTVIVRGMDAIGTTLLLGFGQPVVPLRDAGAPVDERTRGFWSSCTPDAPCMLVHQNFSGLGGLALGPTRSMTIERSHIVPTTKPLPSVVAREVTPVLITPVTGFAPPIDLRLVGAARDWRVDETGFYPYETGPKGTWRWTDGNASIELPALTADRLEVVLETPSHPSAHAVIALDGETLVDTTFAPGMTTLSFPLHGPARQRRLTLRSSSFVPSAMGESNDSRRLGIAIVAVRLIDASVGALGVDAPDRDYKDELALLRVSRDNSIELASGSTTPLALSVLNRSDVVWPTQSDLQPSERPVVLGVQWTTPGGAVVREQDVELPFALRPGERVRFAPNLDPGVLPPGNYFLRIDLLQAGVTWFAARGAAALVVPITVTPRRKAG